MTQLLGNALTIDFPEQRTIQVPGGPATVTGTYRLPEIGGAGTGIWTVEVGEIELATKEELFVILQGAARVLLPDTGEEFEVGPGSIVHLKGGQLSRWAVSETIRKVFVNA